MKTRLHESETISDDTLRTQRRKLLAGLIAAGAVYVAPTLFLLNDALAVSRRSIPSRRSRPSLPSKPSRGSRPSRPGRVPEGRRFPHMGSAEPWGPYKSYQENPPEK